MANVGGYEGWEMQKAPPHGVMQLVGTEYHNAPTSSRLGRLDIDPVSWILVVSTVESGVL
jgi:hypothetical protein